MRRRRRRSKGRPFLAAGLFVFVTATTIRAACVHHNHSQEILTAEVTLSAPEVSFDSRNMSVEVVRQTSHHNRQVSAIALLADGVDKMASAAGGVISFFDSAPKSWSDISAYAPREALHLAAYHVRYALSETPVLDTEVGTIIGPSGNETYYNLDMSWVVWRLQYEGIEGEYHIREDGVKMYGDYIMCAADFSVHPFGSIVQTSLGEAIVCDTGMFIYFDPYHLDIAAAW